MTALRFEEYNLLTQRLLTEGYTVNNYPDHVQLPGSCFGPGELDNLCHGFTYTPQYLRWMVFKTGCGLLVKGSRFNTGNTFYMGILWSPENDNPVITCPYRKKACEHRNNVLGKPIGTDCYEMLQCDCHQTFELYNYENSIEKVRDDENKEMKRKYDEFSERAKGHVCHWNMNYNYQKGKWEQFYDPMNCARMCMNIGKICDLTHKPVDKKKGNVFYDVKVSFFRHDGTLFDGEEVVKITKGVRLFKKNTSLTICEQAAKRCVNDIVQKERNRYHSEILLSGYKVEVLNIRAEQRESRDLMQDLQDISEGIQIIHESDMKRQQEENKRERRKIAQEKKILKLEKKLLEVGYYNLEEYSLDRLHADKWLGEERIDELEHMRRQKEKEKKNQPKQMTLFDFPEVLL